MDEDALRAALSRILPKSQQAKIPRIIEAVHEEIGPYLSIRAVEIPAARVPVETVEIYGLSIAIDANGFAASVGFWETAEAV